MAATSCQASCARIHARLTQPALFFLRVFVLTLWTMLHKFVQASAETFAIHIGRRARGVARRCADRFNHQAGPQAANALLGPKKTRFDTGGRVDEDPDDRKQTRRERDVVTKPAKKSRKKKSSSRAWRREYEGRLRQRYEANTLRSNSSPPSGNPPPLSVPALTIPASPSDSGSLDAPTDSPSISSLSTDRRSKSPISQTSDNEDPAFPKHISPPRTASPSPRKSGMNGNGAMSFESGDKSEEERSGSPDPVVSPADLKALGLNPDREIGEFNEYEPVASVKGACLAKAECLEGVDGRKRGKGGGGAGELAKIFYAAEFSYFTNFPGDYLVMDSPDDDPHLRAARNAAGQIDAS